jgi:hypothetical protein
MKMFCGSCKYLGINYDINKPYAYCTFSYTVYNLPIEKCKINILNNMDCQGAFYQQRCCLSQYMEYIFNYSWNLQDIVDSIIDSQC